MRFLILVSATAGMLAMTTVAKAHGRHHHGAARIVGHAIAHGIRHANRHHRYHRHTRRCFWHRHGPHRPRHRHCR